MTRPRAVPAWAFGTALHILFAVALAFRLPLLNNRPLHADESVHTVKFRELWETGRYQYDPNEFHGPTIYYATLPMVLLRHRANFAATEESDYRLPIAVLGAAMFLWLPLLIPAMGRRALLISAILLAVSPAFVFYSRYYIQEIFLAFFTLGLLACGLQLYRKPGIGPALGTGICAGLMLASKETAVLTFAAALMALALTRRKAVPLPGKYIAIAIGVTLLVAATVVSGFFTNPIGALDYCRSFTPWLHRAGSADLHRHSWDYFLRVLVWYTEKNGRPITTEAFIVALAIVGALSAFFAPARLAPAISPRVVRFLAVYTLLLVIAYSAIPYKTPWCVLTFLQGMILLAGAGAVFVLCLVPGLLGKGIVGLALLLGIGHLGWQAYTASFVAFNDPRCPYVYAPTAPETAELPTKMGQLAHASPDGERMVIQVVCSDGYYWPLPWYLRRLPNVGYGTSLPADLNVPVLLTSTDFDDELTRRLDKTHLMTGYFALRPGVLLQTWVRLDVWQQYLKQHPPDDNNP